MDFHHDPIRPGSHTRTCHWDHLVTDADPMGRIREDGEVALLLDHRNGADIQRVPCRSFECPDSALTQDHLVIAPRENVFRTFETDKEPYKTLEWLTHKRNSIVHYKGKFGQPQIDRLGLRNDIIFKD